VLESGATLAPVDVAYETYGELDADASNAVLVCHALTGDARATGAGGWWTTLVGPGKPVDTERFYVICPNLLGGCRGTTGPSSTNPSTGEPYGLDFPLFTIRDLVSVHRALLRHLGVQRLHTAIGGSLGGMQALQWALDAPEELERAALICASARLSAQNIGFSKVARAAMLRDLDTGAVSMDGMAVARMMAHITYLSEEGMRRKFDRARRAPGPMTMRSDFEVEHYLDHQGEIFLARFDPLTYLYLSRTMDYFEPFAEPPSSPDPPSTHFLLVSFDSDWRFGTAHSLHVLEELRRRGAAAEHVEIASPWGHDSFLMDIPAYHEVIARLLSG
jgi:homoserine O-acetyltransferase/O-succinyltransferase